ncbi:MAG: Tyrosine-protein kinase YwqD [Anaerolineales bacterium]|nr:Tyrosine-protein kinase YwqD [Anaerolineales bacterium]
MELREYTAIIWHWLWLICLGTLLAGGTAFIVSRQMTPIYQASSTLLINQARTPSTTDYSSIIASERIAKTYAELMTQRPILELVAQEIGIDPERFVEDIQVTPVRDTQLIEISIEDPSPRIAAQVANILPQIFIQENEKTQSARFAASKATLSNQLEALNGDIEKTQATIEELGDPETTAQQAELTRLKSTLTQYQSSYANLLQSYENLRLAEAQALDTVIVVEPANAPKYPVRPRTKLNTLLAGVVGAMLATGVAFLIEYLDDTVKSPDDLQQALGLSTLGIIARIQGEDPRERVVAARQPRSPISEAYRTLRTNLEFSAVDTGLRTLLVTSPNPQEGKTTTAGNLAVVMAQGGKDVILVDADMRRPMVHNLFGQSNNYGVTTAIMQADAPPCEYLQETDVPNLRLMTTGSIPPNPAEVLGSHRMQEIVDQLKDEADVVIFDTPPALAVTDAAVLSTKVDGVVLVVEMGRTRREGAYRAMDALSRVDAPLLGAVLNRVSSGRGRGYYYYRYYEYDGYYASEADTREADTRDEGEPSLDGRRDGRERRRRRPGIASSLQRWWDRL